MRVVAKGLALMLGLAVLALGFHASDIGHGLNQAWVDAQVRGHGPYGVLLFLLMAAVLTAIGLPRQIIAFLGGYGFGAAMGTLWSVLGTLLGCLLSFGYARMGLAALRGQLGERAARFDRVICRHPFTFTVLVRLLPVGNNLLTNLAAGLSGIRPLPFFLGSLVGYLPQTLAFALAGSGIHAAPVVSLALGAALFVVFGGLGIWLYRRARTSHPVG